MVVVALLGVLLAVVAPGMGTFLEARRVEDTARRLADDLMTARNEAIKRNAAVLVCANASVADGSCALTPTAQDWARGWRVCVDATGAGTCTPGTADRPNPLRVQDALSPAVTLAAPATRLRFNADGTMDAAVFGAFEIRPARGTGRTWRVGIARSGATALRRG